MTILRVFYEWRAWVRAQKDKREEDLIGAVIDLYEEEWNQYNKRRIAQSIIARIRRHDKEGIQ